jgi:hypothetical protein
MYFVLENKDKLTMLLHTVDKMELIGVIL